MFWISFHQFHEYLNVQKLEPSFYSRERHYNADTFLLIKSEGVRSTQYGTGTVKR